MLHHRKMTDEERREIIAARGQGTPVAALSHRFSVSPRTIYNTLSKAKGARPARTKTVSMRVSDRDLTGITAALAARGISDRPAAMRRLMGAADKVLMAPDPTIVAKLNGWTAEVQTHGTTINRIAHKLNKAKLLSRSLPYTAEDEAAIRALMAFTFTLIDDFRALWDAMREAMSREVDEVLAGLKSGGR